MLVAAAAVHQEGVTAMKSKLSAAFVAGAFVLAVSPANAISFTIDPGITSSVPGAVLFDDFDLVQNTAIGTITGGILNMGSAACVRIWREFHRYGRRPE